MTDQKLIDAKDAIMTAIRQVDTIKPAGRESLLGIAARALNPEVSLSPDGIAQTLGLHPSVMIAITVAADLAGDTDSRREFGLALFEHLRLKARSPRLSDPGRLLLGLWCLEHLSPMQEVLDGDLLQQTLDLIRSSMDQENPATRGRVMELQERAMRLQRNELVGITRGKKQRLGVSEEQQFQRHAAQAIRGLLQGLADRGNDRHVSTTVAGEVARALATGLGFAAAAAFTVALAQHLEEEFPREHLVRPLEN